MDFLVICLGLVIWKDISFFNFAFVSKLCSQEVKIFSLLKMRKTIPFVNYIVCHFGATFMDRRTGDPPFLFSMFKGDLVMKACAKFDEILSVGYF